MVQNSFKIYFFYKHVNFFFFFFSVSTERTVITISPSNMDVTVGESIVLPCQVSHDPSVDVVFTWSFNGHTIDFSRGMHHFERIGRVRFLTSLVLNEVICRSL